jgi:hypothetical protein
MNYEIETWRPNGGFGVSVYPGNPAVKVADPDSGCYVVCQKHRSQTMNKAAAVAALDAMLAYAEGILPCGGMLDRHGDNPMTGRWRDAWCALPQGHAEPHDYRYPDGSRLRVAD